MICYQHHFTCCHAYSWFIKSVLEQSLCEKQSNEAEAFKIFFLAMFVYFFLLNCISLLLLRPSLPAVFNYHHRRAKLSTRGSETALLISTVSPWHVKSHTTVTAQHRGWTCLQQHASPFLKH